MSKVSAINSSGVGKLGPSSRVGVSNTSGSAKVEVNEDFKMPSQEIEQALSTITNNQGQYQTLLVNILMEIVDLDAMVVPKKARRRGNVIVSASFLPPDSTRDHPKVLLPLPAISLPLMPNNFTVSKEHIGAQVAKYVDQFARYLSPRDLIELIVVASHEYGHLRSYRLGNHTKDLQSAIYYYQRRYTNPDIMERFTWLVFKEEFQAWYYGNRMLKQHKFDQWKIFDKSKNNSLSTYIMELKLYKAKISTIYRLSRFGDDFINNCPSRFFNKKIAGN